MSPEQFLRVYGYPLLPFMTLERYADDVEPKPPVKPEPVVEKERDYSE